MSTPPTVSRYVVLGAGALTLSLGAAALDLTADEREWLGQMSEIVQSARHEALPVDVVVQPQDTSGQAPLALAYVEGRCKLVFSLRGNPAAQDALVDAPPALRAGALKLMAAHEMAHCRRHVSGAWNRLPDGLRLEAGTDPQTTTTAAMAEWRAQRREEGFADLAGLGWIAEHRPAEYASLYAWLVQTRSRDAAPYSPHDTLAWLRLAADPAWIHGPALDAPEGLWTRGLLAPD